MLGLCGWKRPAAAAVAALVVGLASHTGSVRAEPLAELTNFDILYSDAVVIHLTIGAPPELVGAPCTILEGMEPFTGTPAGYLVLQPGQNPYTLPQHGFAWLTATGPGLNPASRPDDPDDFGQN